MTSHVYAAIKGSWETIAKRTYVDNSVHHGQRTLEQRARDDAEWLYDQMVCDRRYDPRDVALMILLQDMERSS